MAMQTWACALGILGLSASILCTEFFYKKSTASKSHDCNLCYDNECLVLDEPQCEYYAEADAMFSKNYESAQGKVDNLPIKAEVDNLIFDLIEKATKAPNSMDCIPYISRYTDCNKDNVCIGCRSCSCDSNGNWNCSSPSLCHTQNSALNIDHRVLVPIIENLLDIGRPKKMKRSLIENPEEDKVNTSTITFEQMSEWLYGVKPLNQHDYSPTESEVMDTTVVAEYKVTTKASITESDLVPVAVHTTTENVTEMANISEDYVAFDEVLRSIAVDANSYNRRKLPLNNNLNKKAFDVDYMIKGEDNVTSTNSTEDLAYIVDLMENMDGTTESSVEGATRIVFDLLKLAARDGDHFNTTQDYDIYTKDANIINAFENTNDITEYNAVNINVMKRDVSEIPALNLVPTVTLIVNTTNNVNTSTTENSMDLKYNVLIPLNKIISDKKKELEDLKRIKQNLIKYLKTYDEGAEFTADVNNTSNTYFSIYNLALEPELHTHLRRTDPNNIEKYMFQLKTDIYEVIKDVIGIQSQKDIELPEDFKLLIQAMKHYVYKNKINEGKHNKIKSTQIKNTRRQMVQNYSRCASISFKDCAVQIIQVIDKNMPNSQALSPLSPAARKIIKYLIESFYIDEYSVTGLRVHDLHYNLTKDLNNIGSQWLEMTANIISNSYFVSIYKLKLLHFILTMDISRIHDVLAVIDFAHIRRMFHTSDDVKSDIIERLNAGLKVMHNKIQIIIRYCSKYPKISASINPRAIEETTINPVKEGLDARKKKKRSFIKHIRSLLKSSKKDIAELLHRKVPKSEIVKQLARKKLDEISEKRYNDYEETMKRWQKNLGLVPRIKRSFLDTIQQRIKNIIPNYLRHKVNPRIKASQKNATANAERRADNRKKKRKTKRHGHRTKKTTTPIIKKLNGLRTTKISKVTTQAATVKRSPTTIKL